MSVAYNTNLPAVKRLMQELRDVRRENSSQFTAQPLDVSETQETLFGALLMLGTG
jgi:hypothetical protein